MLVDDHAWPFSFSNLCALFDLAIDQVRADVLGPGRRQAA